MPALPLSREIEQLKNLKRSLVTYGLVFGQPNQEDLLHFLQEVLGSDITEEELARLRIDLSPPKT